MRRLALAVLATLVVSGGMLHAQENDSETAPSQTSPEELEETVNGLGERATLLETEVEKLKALKISGYVQAEWQQFDQTGSVGGRAFYSNANRNLFTVRRGRIKFQHRLGTLMSYTIQPDITETGVRIKDAFATINILPDDELTFNIGMFNRPNYEVELSSSARESAERSQVVRAFYPDERDLGLMFTLRESLFENFDPRLQVGIFNGPGTAAENDPLKDIIARLTFPLPLGSESPVQIDLGASFYHGGVPQTGDSIVRTVDGSKVTVANDATGSMRGMGNKQNFNIEGQIYLDLLPIGGTIIKGEFLTGRRPTGATAATPATVGTARDSTGADIIRIIPGTAARPLQIRNQSGFYAYFIQNIGTPLQLVAKYDMFDRNTDISGTRVTALDDAAVSVLGFGAHIFYENLRITAWYEIPTFAADENRVAEDIKDNKTTIRFQYKF